MEDMGEHRMGGEVGVGCMEGTCRVGLGGGVCIGRGRVVDSMTRGLASSSSLSCRRLLLAKFASRWNGNGGSNRRSVK